MQETTTAYSICFPEKKSPSFSKPWWNQETNNAKELLSAHFNAWKENGFSKENEDVFYNRYILARKNFRKTIKNAQNKKIYDTYIKINKLKNIHPQNFWKQMRQLKKK